MRKLLLSPPRRNGLQLSLGGRGGGGGRGVNYAGKLFLSLFVIPFNSDLGQDWTGQSTEVPAILRGQCESTRGAVLGDSRRQASDAKESRWYSSLSHRDARVEQSVLVECRRRRRPSSTPPRDRQSRDRECVIRHDGVTRARKGRFPRSPSATSLLGACRWNPAAIADLSPRLR